MSEHRRSVERDLIEMMQRSGTGTLDRPGCALRADGAGNGREPYLSKHLPASDRLEGIAEVIDPGRRSIVGPDDRHDVEAAAYLEKLVSCAGIERRRS